MLKRILAASFFFLISTPSLSEVKKYPGKDGDADLIILKGEIDQDAEKTFRALALETESAIVVLDSPGGLVRSAIEIGRMIRIKNYSTAVLEAECVSACALVWLAGSSRLSHPNSSVGFHAAYTEDADGRKVPAAVGNALVGAYLNSLGLSASVVEYVTTASPDSVKWLSRSHADALGLNVRIIDDKNRARVNFNRAVRSRWGEERSLSDAVRLYRESAEDGFAGALNNLGDLYESGEGVRRNEKFAAYLYARAAERGEPTAYLSLATFLSENTDDEHILVDALKFAFLAYAGLPQGRNKQTAAEAIRSISASLGASQRKKALDLAESWRPLYQERYLMSDTPRQ